jgi:bla regulator protein blaR1
MSTTILAHLLQSTLFAVLIALFVHGFRASAARVRYWLWLTASVKFLLPLSWLTVLRPSFNWQPEHPAVASALASPTNYFSSPLDVTAWIDVPERLPGADAINAQLFVFIWLAGACIVTLRWIATWLQVRAVARAAAPLTIAFPVPVRSSAAVREPGIFGIINPVLLLPRDMHSQLTPEQLAAVLAHECAHLRRRDNLTAAVQMLVQIAFWFHPLVWWIGRKLLQERERACDEAVLDAGHDRVAYATAIIDVCRQLCSPRAMCVAGVSSTDLTRRIEDILSARLGASPSTVGTSVLVVGIVVIAALSSLLGSPSTATALSRDEPSTPIQLSEVLLRPNRSTRPPWIGTIDGKLTLLNVPLRTVIAIAHGTGYRPVVDGPAWLDLGYDVQVSGNYSAFDPTSNHAMMSRILRQMVNDKLGVTGKLESRELGVFAMRVSPEGLDPLVFRPYVPGDAEAKDHVWPATMPQIASALGRQLKHVVVDRTGRTETYAFRPHLAKVALHRATPETLPTVVRKIGLQLEFVIEPVDVFAIVSVTQPVANWKSESR